MRPITELRYVADNMASCETEAGFIVTAQAHFMVDLIEAIRDLTATVELLVPEDSQYADTSK